jgi:hypothetical protein
MRADVIANDVDERDRRRSPAVDLLKQFDELNLSFSPATQPNDFAGACIEGREEVERSFADVLMLEVGWYGPWLRRASLGRSCSGLE